MCIRDRPPPPPDPPPGGPWPRRRRRGAGPADEGDCDDDGRSDGEGPDGAPSQLGGVGGADAATGGPAEDGGPAPAVSVPALGASGSHAVPRAGPCADSGRPRRAARVVAPVATVPPADPYDISVPRRLRRGGGDGLRVEPDVRA
eukprot:5542848-Alexandrium_andersonii.AAC.1